MALRAAAATTSRAERADQTARRLWFEVERLRGEGISTLAGLAQALTERGVQTLASGAGLDQYQRGAANDTSCWNRQRA